MIAADLFGGGHRTYEIVDGVRMTPYIRHRPHPPQAEFLRLDCLEALYGGAAGGGKSDALLMAALQYVDVPGYAAILLRRTLADLELPGALIPRSKEWLAGTDARYNENRHRWTFPSGATLSFGYIERRDDHLRYQGAEFQFVGVDELTQIPEYQFTYLISRLRRPRGIGDRHPLASVPLRFRAATNPGGPSHKQVKRRFIDRLPDPDDPEDTPEKCAARVFIPSRLSDNPSVDQEAYVASLGALDPQTRSQLLSGDWNAREPGDWVIPVGLDEAMQLGRQLREHRPPPVGDQIVIGADWGIHAHLLVLWPLEADGVLVAREVVNDQASIRTVAPRVADEILALEQPLHSVRFDASMPGLQDAFMERLRPLLPWRVRSLAVPFGKFKSLSIDWLRLLAGNAHLRVRHPAGKGLDELDEPALRRLARTVGEQHDPAHVTAREIIDTLTDRALGPVLAIDDEACPVLAEQLRQWRFADPDTNRTEKGDDHGPDALIAGVAPAAAKRQPRGRR